MKNNSEEMSNAEAVWIGICMFIIFPAVLVFGVSSCNDSIDERRRNNVLAEQQEEYSHSRNLIQCYQNGVLYKTYLVGHIYDTCYNQYYKQGKRHYTNIICSNRINTTVIDTNEKINIGLENCIIKELLYE